MKQTIMIATLLVFTNCEGERKDRVAVITDNENIEDTLIEESNEKFAQDKNKEEMTFETLKATIIKNTRTERQKVRIKSCEL